MSSWAAPALLGLLLIFSKLGPRYGSAWSKYQIHCPVQRPSSAAAPLVARRHWVTVAFINPVNVVQPSVLLEFVPSMTGMQPPKHDEHITVYIPAWQLSVRNLVSIIKPLHLSQQPIRRATTNFTTTINPSKSVVGLPGLLKIPFKGVGLSQKAWLPQKACTVHPVTAPVSRGLSTVGLPTSVSLDHSLCYTAIHFDSSFGEPRTLIGDMKRVCLLLKMGHMAGSEKPQIGT